MKTQPKTTTSSRPVALTLGAPACLPARCHSKDPPAGMPALPGLRVPVPGFSVRMLRGILPLLALVALPARAGTFTVLNPADTGGGSLRQAVADANVAGGAKTITFAPALSGATITLTSGQIEITNSLTITAAALPGGIQIKGNASSRIFQVFNPSIVTLDSLTITNGAGSIGGGWINNGTLTVNLCTIVNNHTTAGNGGGI